MAERVEGDRQRNGAGLSVHGWRGGQGPADDELGAVRGEGGLAGGGGELREAFLVLAAIIGLLTAGYAASLRRAVRRPECDINVTLPAGECNSVSR